MYSLNLHFNYSVYVWKKGDKVVYSVDVEYLEGVYESAEGSSLEESINRLLVALKKKHPDVNIHLHLVQEPE